MLRVKEMKQQSRQLIARTGLPAEFFRRLFRTCHVGIGSQCRVAGFADDAVAEYLTWLGLHVSGHPTSHDDGNGTSNGDAATVSLPKTKCELVLSPMSCLSPRMLRDVSMLRQTADLLASLEPNGHLVFVSDQRTETAPANDMPESYRRYLAEFPGECSSWNHRQRGLRNLISGWSNSAEECEFEAVSLKTPETSVSRREWMSIADRAGAANPVVCCDSSAIERPSADMRDAA